MQRDGSNALHLCFCWNQIYKYIVSSEQILVNTMADDAATKLHEALQKRNKLMRSCGVFHLFSALWPEPDVSLGDRAKIVDELKILVEKQWDEWQKFPRAIALPKEYVGADGKSKEEFILRVTAQLNVHIAGPPVDGTAFTT